MELGPGELWGKIPGWDKYEASTYGRVRRVGRKVLKQRLAPMGSLVNLSQDGRRSVQVVHRVVALTFIGESTRLRHYTWKDGNRSNNRLDNLVLREATHCTRCGLKLTASNTYQRARGGRFSRCKTCVSELAKVRHASGPRSELRRSLSPDNRCAICGDSETYQRDGKLRRLAVDHDHSTGVVRGVLCTRCNSGLGMFRDKPALLRAAALYLEEAALSTRPGLTRASVLGGP